MPVSPRLPLAGLALALVSACILAPLPASAQFAPTQAGTQIRDASLLRPPAGARVAIVEFVDLQCPVCALTNPHLKNAMAQYKIPLVRHELLIPNHNWSFNAAINARWFDLKSKALGDEYRDQLFANQSSITGPDVLLRFTQNFAAARKIPLPFAIDPQGALAAAVKADNAQSLAAGITHTPTVFVVSANSKGAPFTEILHPDNENLFFPVIAQALADTAAEPKVFSAKKVAANETTPAAPAPAAPVEATPAASPTATAPSPAVNQAPASPQPASHTFPLRLTLLWGAFAAILAGSIFALINKRRRQTDAAPTNARKSAVKNPASR
jgi:protein-disulfide isomerase